MSSVSSKVSNGNYDPSIKSLRSSISFELSFFLPRSQDDVPVHFLDWLSSSFSTYFSLYLAHGHNLVIKCQSKSGLSKLSQPVLVWVNDLHYESTEKDEMFLF